MFFLETEHKRSADGVINEDERSITLVGFKAGDDVEAYRDPQGLESQKAVIMWCRYGDRFG